MGIKKGEAGRARVKDLFSIMTMASNYKILYYTLLGRKQKNAA